MNYLEIITIFISVLALVVSIVTYYIKQKYEKRNSSIEAYINLQESLFFLYEYEDNEIEEFVTDRHSKEYKVLSTCLARIEIFATGVEEKMYDFEIIYKMAHGYIDISLRKKIEYLLEMKQGVYFYQNTIRLLEKMDKKSRK